jgi:hypothetical protein
MRPEVKSTEIRATTNKQKFTRGRVVEENKKKGKKKEKGEKKREAEIAYHQTAVPICGQEPQGQERKEQRAALSFKKVRIFFFAQLSISKGTSVLLISFSLSLYILSSSCSQVKVVFSTLRCAANFLFLFFFETF